MFFLVCFFLYLFERNAYLNLFNIHFILRYGSLCWIIRFQDILADSATTHTILRDQIYFSHITLVEANVNTISGLADLIDSFRKATIMYHVAQYSILTMP